MVVGAVVVVGVVVVVVVAVVVIGVVDETVVSVTVVVGVVVGVVVSAVVVVGGVASLQKKRRIKASTYVGPRNPVKSVSVRTCAVSPCANSSSCV